ncbi:MAG: hypothetical protein IKN59_09335 [Paludibacteraceae bacterium]|nr:hypothetical protein [Paludibacteraceae bacterium]
MAKQVKIVLLLAVLCGYSSLLSAQVQHYLGWWAQGGEYSYQAVCGATPTFSLRTSLGGGGGLGFVYELRAGGHFLLDVGVGANSVYTRFKVPDMQSTLHNVIDSEGEVFDYVFDVTNRKDAYFNTSLQIPLLVGGQWGKFYFLAGAKFDMVMMSLTTTKATVSTLGDYKQYIDPLRNIPSQGFVDGMQWVQKGRASFKPTVLASAEIGMRLGPVYKETGYDVPQQKIQYRLALFADYAVLDQHKAGDQPLLHVPATYSVKDPLQGMHATDVMSSREVESLKGRFFPMMIGVKFTMLFRVPEKKSCVMCKELPFRSSHGLLE